MEQCEAEFSSTDFDGTNIFVPCGGDAVVEFTSNCPHLAADIASGDGWEEYRAWTIYHEDEDPGPDPGQDKWGHVTLRLCREHAVSYEMDMAILDDGHEVVERKDLV